MKKILNTSLRERFTDWWRRRKDKPTGREKRIENGLHPDHLYGQFLYFTIICAYLWWNGTRFGAHWTDPATNPTFLWLYGVLGPLLFLLYAWLFRTAIRSRERRNWHRGYMQGLNTATDIFLRNRR